MVKDLQENARLLFGRNNNQQLVNRIFRYFSLHDAISNGILCHSFMVAKEYLRLVLEQKFGTIVVIDCIVYVSKKIDKNHCYYFMNERYIEYFDVLIMRARKLVRIESIIFIQKMCGKWLLSIPEKQGKPHNFSFKHIRPAKLDYYVSRFLSDNGEGLALINTEGFTEYLYYDSVIIQPDQRIYTKKLKNGIIRNVVWRPGKEHVEVNAFNQNIQPGIISNLTKDQMAEAMFVIDVGNSCAIMADVNCELSFLGPQFVKVVPMTEQFKKRRSNKCLNK